MATANPELSKILGEDGAVIARRVTQAFDPDELIPDAAAKSWVKSTSDTGVATLIEELWVPTESITAYSIHGSLTSEPIETHPKMVTLLASATEELTKWRLWLKDSKDPKLGGWDPRTATTEGVQRLFYYWQRGTNSYLKPRVSIKKQYINATPSISNNGKISSPGVSLTGIPNWLQSGAEAELVGSMWRISGDYLGGAGSGWNNFLYGDAASP